MNKLFLSILCMVFAIAVQAGQPGKSETLKVNTTESGIAWTASKITGKHHGSVAIKEGGLTISDGILTGGSFTIDMNTMTVLDMEGNGKSKLEGHLRSDDFFNVQDFPTATFVITDTRAKGNFNYTIKGDLTIKGITHPAEFNALLKPEGNAMVATANIIVDRTLYDVRYGSGKFFEGLGDSMIYDEFELAVTLVAE